MGSAAIPKCASGMMAVFAPSAASSEALSSIIIAAIREDPGAKTEVSHD